MVAADLTLNGSANLGVTVVTVASNAELTLSASQANGKTITGATATSGGSHHGGSVVVTGLDNSAFNLSGLTAGAASSPAGSTTAGRLRLWWLQI